MAWKKVHRGRRAVMGAALPALVIVVGIALVMLRTAADPVIRTISVGFFWQSPLVVVESTRRAFVDIYDAGGHSRIQMLDAATGAIVRTIAIPGWVGALGVAEQGARIVVASPKGLRVLDAHNGALVRAVHLSPTPNALLMDARAGRIYVASSGTTSCTNRACTTSDDALAVLDARTGRLLHTARLQDQGWTTLALDGRVHHLILVTSSSARGKQGAVSIFDTVSGRLLYRTPFTPAVQPAPLVDEVTGRIFLVAAYHGCGMWAGSLEVRDTHRGRLLRPIPLGTCPADAALDKRIGRVFVTSFGAVRLIAASPPIGGGQRTPVAVGAGSVRVLDARSGILLRTIPIGPATTAVAVDARRRRLYVTNEGADDAAGNPVGPGNLTVLDDRSGRVLRTVAVGVNPVSLVLDRRAGRLFVVNAGTYNPIRSADPWAWVPPWLRHWLPFLPQHAPPPRRIPGNVTVLDTSRL